MPKLTDILAAHGVLFKRGGQHHHVRHRWIGVDCPQCGPGTGKYRLGFSADGRRANCWACGRMDVAQALAAVCRLPLGKGIELSKDLNAGVLPPAVPLRGTYKPPGKPGPLLPAQRGYLTRRGFDPDVLMRVWGIQGIGPAARLSWRIFIPVFDELARPVTWTTRSIKAKGKDRYISANPEEAEINIHETLYGCHLARHAVVVVEGPTDAWAIGPGAVATCGLGYSSEQAAAISEYPIRAVCFDSDPTAQRRAAKLCRRLAALPGRTTNIRLETGGDPGDAAKSELAAIRREFLE